MQVSGSDYAYTHYVYDLFGRVKYVIQPQGWEIASTSGLTSTVLANYTFQYVYDGRGRVIEKIVPGADTVYMVYNKLDQVVFSQDGRQRSLGNWLFTKYEALGRPIITGLYASAVSRASLQTSLNNHSSLYESRSGASYPSLHGYTNAALPDITLSAVDLLSVTHYDDYDFDLDGTPDVTYESDPENSFPGHSPSVQTTGMVTAVEVAIPDADTDMPSWLLTYTFYDKYGREIQTRADNHLNGKPALRPAQAHGRYPGITQRGRSQTKQSILKHAAWLEYERYLPSRI